MSVMVLYEFNDCTGLFFLFIFSTVREVFIRDHQNGMMGWTDLSFEESNHGQPPESARWFPIIGNELYSVTRGLLDDKKRRT